jgi:hypothetical protein
MKIEETVTYLEMTSADQLRPGRFAPTPVEMVRLDQAAASLLRRTYARIAVPLNWQSRRTWAHLLTVGTGLAWKLEPLDGGRVRRVWLHTSSRDHPHAKPNYERRGFRPCRTERRQRDIPT